ncbi:aspartyl-phosphate phosphatase Spo0E family protein [Clostridium tagluense]|uniref:aspartyl-phosphate phosphatase Spo0E family protein n=1 Tax=Clostridium tagluense TaxID=360422 RepID=UPI001C0B6B41|nr:aspartyl-phosphate phosphatase Spo0E family protein [Clostridium tagluense]MBU3126776.1 aspartyl-phosphate phosphatase Spo0E family protein [Clostridium tagluense]
MTPTAKLVLTVYSILVVMVFMIRNLRRDDKGWKGGVTYTNTNIINGHLEDILKLYFDGFSVKKAIKKVRTIEELKLKLDKLIIKNNFNMIAPEVVRLSQKLDKEIVNEQRKRLLCKAT